MCQQSFQGQQGSPVNSAVELVNKPRKSLPAPCISRHGFVMPLPFDSLVKHCQCPGKKPHAIMSLKRLWLVTRYESMQQFRQELCKQQLQAAIAVQLQIADHAPD